MENQKRIRSSFDTMLEGIQIIDFNWRYQYINDVQINQLKLSKETIIGYTIMEKFPNIEDTEYFKVLQNCMTNRIANNLEIEFTFPDSTIGWFEISIQPVPEGLLILSIDTSEQKKAEVNFHESELFSSAVLSSLISHIAVVNSAGKIEIVNKAWDDFAKENGGLMPNSVSTGSNYFDVCKKSIIAGDPYAKKALEGIKSVLNNTIKVFEMEYPCNSPNEQRWFNQIVSKFGEEENKVVIVHENITTRKLMEEVKNANETKYRRLFETAKDGILILDADSGKIVDVNPFLSKILGFSYNYFIGKELWEIGLFQDVKASKIAFCELLEKEYIRYEDLPLKTIDEKHLYVEFVSNVYLVNGQKVIQCNIRDITERKIAEENIRKSELRLNEAQAISHTANWEIDLLTNVNTWSEEFHNILDLKIGIIQPSLEIFLNLIFKADNEAKKIEFQQAFDTLVDSNLNFSFIGNDGLLKFAYLEWQFEYNKQKQPIRLYGIIQDITERKTVEEKLEQQYLELKKTNEELDRFVYSTSHDLRAPLSSLLGLINLMEEYLKPSEDDQKELLGMMKQSINKLDSFIDDIMSYSRNSRMEIATEEINFEALINESLQRLKFMDQDGKCSIKTEIVQTGKFISDPKRILIITNNLISNALKYQDSAKSNPYVNITIHSNSTNATIIITDNGIGIANDKQEKVFDMFYRATSQSKGSGLGMYIAKETMLKLKGTINLTSKLNTGSTFTISIPNLL